MNVLQTAITETQHRARSITPDRKASRRSVVDMERTNTEPESPTSNTMKRESPTRVNLSLGSQSRSDIGRESEDGDISSYLGSSPKKEEDYETSKFNEGPISETSRRRLEGITVSPSAATRKSRYSEKPSSKPSHRRGPSTSPAPLKPSQGDRFDTDLSGTGINIVEEGTVVKAVQTSDYYAFLLRSCQPDVKNVFRF